jgi:hypothetical protein
MQHVAISFEDRTVAVMALVRARTDEEIDAEVGRTAFDSAPASWLRITADEAAAISRAMRAGQLPTSPGPVGVASSTPELIQAIAVINDNAIQDRQEVENLQHRIGVLETIINALQEAGSRP